LGTNFGETTQLVRATGALLAFLQRGAIVLHTNAGSTLQHFVRFDGFSRCVLDQDSLAALQIFHQVNHPSVLMSAPKKEGVSLFGVLNRTVTAGGKRLMKSWLKRPSLDLAQIEERHSAVEHFSSTTADILLNQVRSCLSGFADVNTTLKRLASTQVPSVSSFSSLLATCQQCHSLASLLSHAQASQPDSPLSRLRIAQKVNECMTTTPQQVINIIEGLVDMKGSMDSDQLKVSWFMHL
jgi:DNA mismatch repair protein MSH5